MRLGECESVLIGMSFQVYWNALYHLLEASFKYGGNLTGVVDSGWGQDEARDRTKLTRIQRDILTVRLGEWELG